MATAHQVPATRRGLTVRVASSWGTWEAQPSVSRLVLAGGPRAGKTTLAAILAAGRPVIHTDDYIDCGWDKAPAAIVQACQGLSSFVLEGCRAPWALREGLQVDGVLWLGKSFVELNDGQAALAKAARSVLDEWLCTTSCPVVWK